MKSNKSASQSVNRCSPHGSLAADGADKVAAGVIFLAWRCLYTETVKAQIDDRRLRPKQIYARLVVMIISRLKAEGQKWYRWYSKTRGIYEQSTLNNSQGDTDTEDFFLFLKLEGLP